MDLKRKRFFFSSQHVQKKNDKSEKVKIKVIQIYIIRVKSKVKLSKNIIKTPL